ncbi:zinc-binding dehydrogenase [Tessaracoccus antarcticus]|uniref:Alcohol dehydrogenase n=1 Tax=Tessaracoccus antarcticus TaxID=2479848 RepID=A0A3M0GSE3_9ACTN|nr:zinc-binding dehydrogenase [Tessaracoccus antarcticus]RMB60226.1 alcohol dehydrogenase [Tessaracoccus antarcticus]
MDGLVFIGNSKAEIRDFEVPAPGPTEVLIRIRASGLCGSDFHTYDTEEGLRGPDGAFIAAGHEPAGEVEEVGELVTGFSPGDRVSAHHLLGCGYCRSCLMGYPVSCSSSARAAYGGHRNGGHAEYLLAESRSLIHLPDNVSFIDGAMVACGFSTAFSACRKATITAGDFVLVAGLGPVGLSVAMIASSLGAIVMGVDIDRARAEKSREFGIVHTVSSSAEADAVEEVNHFTGGHRVDVAIDCTGSDAARHLCLEAAAVWGRVVFIGFGGGDLSVNVAELFIMKQLTVKGSWVSSMAESSEAVRLISRLNLHPDRMVTATYGLREGVAAYKAFKKGAPGKLAIVS